jgi:hypothetical protein
MAPTPRKLVDAREALPGIIKVTPIPIEPPIHGRPVLQSHETPPFRVVVNGSAFPFHVNGGELKGSSVRWGACTLLVLLALLLGATLSNWGWNMITGRIWRWSSKWDGPFEMGDEEQLLPQTRTEDAPKDPEIPVNFEEIYEPQDSSTEYSLEDWINKRPREICNQSAPTGV